MSDVACHAKQQHPDAGLSHRDKAEGDFGCLPSKLVAFAGISQTVKNPRHVDAGFLRVPLENGYYLCGGILNPAKADVFHFKEVIDPIHRAFTPEA